MRGKLSELRKYLKYLPDDVILEITLVQEPDPFEYPAPKDDKTITYPQPPITLPFIQEIPNSFIASCCRNCSNHPSNGGSGLCHCAAPYFAPDNPYKVTCNVGEATTTVTITTTAEITD